jgi:hypothetical protein
MVSILQFQKNEIRKLTLKEILLQLRLQDDSIFWVDLETPEEAEDETLFVSIFNFPRFSFPSVLSPDFSG